MPRDHAARALPGRLVRREHVLNGRGSMGRGSVQHPLDCTRDAEEGDVALKERGDGDLVGGIQRDAGRGAGGGRFVGQAQAGETGRSGWAKSSRLRAARSKVRDGAASPASTRSG